MEGKNGIEGRGMLSAGKKYSEWYSRLHMFVTTTS